MTSPMPRRPRHYARSLLPLLFLPAIIIAATSTATTAASASYNRTSNCTLLPDADIVRKAFLDVINFRLPRHGRSACRPVRRLRFPSSNLTGVPRWDELANLSSLLTLNLSGNSLEGELRGAFWRAPSLRAVDLSGNRLGGALRFEPSTRLRSLDVSGNRFTSVEGVGLLHGLESLDLSGNVIGKVPEGLPRLGAQVRRLDLSRNSMAGRFPDDFPRLDGVEFLNISHNNFSGMVDARIVRKFGPSAFLQAGNALLVVEDLEPAPATKGRKKHRRVVLIVVVVVAVATVAFLAGCVACGLNLKRGKKRGKKKDKDGRDRKSVV